MKTFLTYIFTLMTLAVAAADRESVADGDWSDKCTWDLACLNAIPDKSDNVTIYHDVVLDISLTGSSQIKGTLTITSSGSLTDASGGSAFGMKVQNQGTLIVEGTVTIEGDVDFQGDADLIIRDNSTLTINGDVSWSGDANIIIESGSTMNIGGTLDIASGADNIDIDGEINIDGDLNIGANADLGGDGEIIITGDVSNSGTVFGTTGSNANCTDCTLPQDALPVDLVYFAASKENGGVKLTWETSLEINNSHFEVQRSTDASNWEVLTTIEGMGTYIGNTHYEYTDMSSLEGLIYYRLKQIDFDGKFEYSGIAAVQVNGSGALFPEVISQNSGLWLVGSSATSSRYQVLVSNSTGQVLYTEDVQTAGQLSHKLNFVVPKGDVLLISITNAHGERVVSKVVVW